MAQRRDGAGGRQLRALNCPVGHKLQETNITPRVVPIIGEHCHRGFAVSAGPPECLQIVFNRGRMLPMDHHANIWNVQAHAERACADDPIDLWLTISDNLFRSCSRSQELPAPVLHQKTT